MKITSYRANSGVDLCIQGYAHIEGLVAFCRDNNLVVDHEETAATERLVNDALKAELVNNRPLFPVRPTARQDTVTVNSGQNLVDLALQETGSVEGFVSILRNNGFAAGDEPAIGTAIKTSTADIVNAEVRSYYKNFNYKVNTGDAAATITGGIGVMIIESTFIVSS